MLGAVFLNHVLRQGFLLTNQEPQESSFFFPQYWGYRSVLLYLAVPGDGELNSGPYVFKARILQLSHLANQANTGWFLCLYRQWRAEDKGLSLHQLLRDDLLVIRMACLI